MCAQGQICREKLSCEVYTKLREKRVAAEGGAMYSISDAGATHSITRAGVA